MRTSVALVCCGFLFAACSQKPPPVPKVNTVAAAPASAAPAPPSIAAAPQPPVAESPQSLSPSADPFSQFNRALRTWAMERDVLPTSFEQLQQYASSYGGLPPIPPAPAGRRLTLFYDKRTGDQRTLTLKAE